MVAWDISPVVSSDLSKIAVNGLRINATASLPATDLPTLNEWQQLTVASHSRKVITGSSPADAGTYSTLVTGAQADVEALSPQTVTAIPSAGYNILVSDGAGTMYISGSLHSGYRGCEINIMDMPVGAGNNAISVALSHQPTAPPSGPNSGYAAGLGGYIYKQAFAAESVVGYDDQTEALDWKPFIGHDWTMSSWTPTTGFCTIVAHAVQTGQTAGQPYHTGTFSIVDGVLQSSHSQPSDNYTSGAGLLGLVGFDEATGRFKTWLSQLSPEITSLVGGGHPFTSDQAGLGRSGLSDYNPNDGSILLFNSISSLMNCIHYVPATHTVRMVASMESSGATGALTGMGGGVGSSENGWLIRHLEGTEYLMLRQNLTGRSGIGIFTFDESYGSGDARRIDLTSSLPGGGTGEPFEGVGSSSDPLSFAVDKTGRRVFWLVIRLSAAPKFYVSSFDSLMTWTEVTMTGLSTWADAAVWHTLCRQPLHYYDGYLYLLDNAAGVGAPSPNYHSGAANFKRAYVGAAA